MTNVMDAFEHLDSMSQTQLFERRTQLIGTAPNGDYKQLDDNALMELVAIHRVLRRKSSSPAKVSSSRKGGNLVPSLDSI
jgi:hypothetical protein